MTTPTSDAKPGVLLPAAVFLLTVAISPDLEAPAWSARAALLLVVAAAGLPMLVAQAVRGSVAARLALAWTLWCALSTALSDDPIASLVGLYNWGTGLLFVVVLGSCFAVGAAADEPTRSRVATALTAGVLVNAAIAVAQLAELLQTPPLAGGSRSSGAIGNSAHLGALAAATLLLVVVPARVGVRVRFAVAVALALALQASASRVSLLLLGAAALVLALQRNRTAVAIVLTAAALGTVGAAAIDGLAPAANESSTSRLADGSTGIGVRVATWRSGLEAIGADPIVGAGPGRFREATLPHRSAEQAAAQEGGSFVDAHNLFVEYAVTTGPVGAALLGAFLLVALRRARGRWLWFAAVLLGVHLVQPQSVVPTPLLFLALGLAQPLRPSGAGPAHEVGEDRASRVPVRLAQLPLTVVAVAAAAALVLGDAALHRGRFDLSVASAKRADSLLPPWPHPATIVARAYAFQYENGLGEADAREALRWYAEAARRAPGDPDGWIRLARQQTYHAQPVAAERSLRRAIAADRHSVPALNRLAALLSADGRNQEAVAVLRRSLAVEPGQKKAAATLERLCAEARSC